MRAKTLLTILLVFLFTWLVVSTVRSNASVVTVRFAFFPPVPMELWTVMLAAFGSGAALILLFDIAGGAKRFAMNRRLRKEQQAHQEVEALYLEGLDGLVNGHYEKALQKFEEVTKREPRHENALVKTGDSLRALGRYREAAEVLERSTQLAPTNLVAHYSLCDVYLEAGADERAKAILERIIELDPVSTVSAHRKLRDMFVGRLDWEAANEIQNKLVTMVSREEERNLERSVSRGIKLGLAHDLASRGRTEEAIETLRSILEEDERFVPAYVRLGEALADEDETEEAIRTWRRGYDVTGSTEPLSALEGFYLRDEQPEAAIGVWKQALLLSDNEVPLRYCLGKLYYRMFMLDEALREFQMIEDRVTGLPALHLFIARILESKEDLSGALQKTKMLIGEVEGLAMDYICEACEWRLGEWTARCVSCGRWDTVGLHLQSASSPEPTIQPAPTWSTP